LKNHAIANVVNSEYLTGLNSGPVTCASREMDATSFWQVLAFMMVGFEN